MPSENLSFGFYQLVCHSEIEPLLDRKVILGEGESGLGKLPEKKNMPGPGMELLIFFLLADVASPMPKALIADLLPAFFLFSLRADIVAEDRLNVRYEFFSGANPPALKICWQNATTNSGARLPISSRQFSR